VIPDVVEVAQALIRAPSQNPPGDERACARAVEDALGACGLPPPRRIALDERRPNLLTTVDFGPGGRHLVLAGHLDTKPVGDATWTVDPHGAEVDGDRLTGLGSADMKAALAAMVVAVARLAADPPPAGRVSLLFTADEEDGAAFGARHVAASTPLHADGVVIGEPGGIDDDHDRLHLVSRGIARMRLVARAAQGHSSLAGVRLRRNAGVDAARAVAAVAGDLRLSEPADPHGLEGWQATVNAGLRFRGGVGYGVLPEAVAVDTEVRLLPGMTRAEVGDAVAAVLARQAARDGADVRLEFDEPPNDWLEPSALDPAHALAEAARGACAATLGTVPPDSVFPGTTDATWFAGLQGLAVLPALGPGLLERAHAADEWVSAAAVRRSVDLFAELSRRFCPAQAPVESPA
jgi:succinyl-diaminopimelate desuccinylase